MIAANAIQTELLAPVAAWARFGDALRSSRHPADIQEGIPYLVGLAIVVVGFILYNRRAKKNDMSIPCNDPAKLFRELCMAHQLSGAEQKSLRLLAEIAFPDQPAQIFLSPAALRKAALPQALAPQAELFEKLRQKLFQ